MKYVFPEYKENVVLGNGKLQLNPMSYQVIYEGNVLFVFHKTSGRFPRRSAFPE